MDSDYSIPNNLDRELIMWKDRSMNDGLQQIPNTSPQNSILEPPPVVVSTKQSKRNLFLTLMGISLIIILGSATFFHKSISKGSKNISVVPTRTNRILISASPIPTSTMKKSTPTFAPTIKINQQSGALVVDDDSLGWRDGLRMSATYLSPNKKNLFYPMADTAATYSSPNCSFAIYEQENNESYILTDKISKGKLSCGDSMGDFSSDFSRWIDNSRFIYHGASGNIQLVDLNDFARDVSIYKFEPTLLNFLGVDNSLNFFLFEKKDGSSNSIRDYAFYNKENSLHKELIFPSSTTENAVYIGFDDANSGFIFADQKIQASDDMATVDFIFVPISTFEQETIYTTRATPVQHRGCYPDLDLQTSTHKIRVLVGCMNIGSQDLDSEGYINISLN
jgi:hypothetical protein